LVSDLQNLIVWLHFVLYPFGLFIFLIDETVCMIVNGFPQTFRNVTGFPFDPNGRLLLWNLDAHKSSVEEAILLQSFALPCVSVTPTAERPRVLGARRRSVSTYGSSRRTRERGKEDRRRGPA
jgi:hypothetical protein